MDGPDQLQGAAAAQADVDATVTIGWFLRVTAVYRGLVSPAHMLSQS